MKRGILAGRLTPDDLESMGEKILATNYECSRDTARKARRSVLSEFAEQSNSDKLTTNDK